MRTFLTAMLGGAILASCAGSGGGADAERLLPASRSMALRNAGASQRIDHIIVIVQENRSVDDLFQFLPGANTQSWGLNSNNQRVSLEPDAITAPYDIEHNHDIAWRREYNNGAMNGFDRDLSVCSNHKRCPRHNVRAYGYVPQDEVQPYYTMAEEYAFGDKMFETSEAGSFPAHQYIVSGTSTIFDGAPDRASENPGHELGGCDSPPNTLVRVINEKGGERKKVYPCFDRRSIFTLLDSAGISWHYYQAHTGAHLWNAVDALEPIWSDTLEYEANVIVPPPQVLNDTKNGKLSSVVFVTPSAAQSDHADVTDGSGPSWVASVVNAVGESQYWKSSAIIVTWDDWGGWYDHVKPTVRNSLELGFRVPVIVISPYAKARYVSHTPLEFGSILKFIEETYDLGSLETTDRDANDLSDCFDFGQKPRKFQKIQSPLDAEYFLHLPDDPRSPDDE